MGERGQITRLLAAKYGGHLTFAALSAERASAPGQPTIQQLKVGARGVGWGAGGASGAGCTGPFRDACDWPTNPPPLAGRWKAAVGHAAP